MRKLFLSFVISIILLLSVNADSTSASSPALTPAGIISAINAYRAQNGLPAYQVNNTLMALAQGQSDYQASINTVTHNGPGGTRPRDRAYNAGYGGGAIIFVSEIIYGGTNATVDVAMTWWKGSPIHNDTMLASTYVEIGAGVSTDGTWTYFTAEMAYVAGGVAPTSGPGGGTGSGEGPAPVIVIPVVVATPQTDGSVYHIVRTGQTLWAIAAVYGVDLQDLLALNGLPENAVIYPGDEILVVAGASQTETPTITVTSPITVTLFPTVLPTFTSIPATELAAVFPDQSSEPDNLPEGAIEVEDPTESSTIRWIVIIAVAGIFLVVVGSLLLPKTEEE